jgi:hypothetical protein
MASIKGVMLLPLDAEATAATWRTTLPGQGEFRNQDTDSRLELTQLVEERVRQEMQLRFSATRFRVLRWEQVDLRNRYVVRFRELDGVFETGNGVTVLLEVKASASKGSLKTGLEQLRAAVKTATHTHASTVGVLVVADLGEWFDTSARPQRSHWRTTLRAWTWTYWTGLLACPSARPRAFASR